MYEYCKCKKPIQRLWISSLEEKAIAEGFRNLKDGTDYEKLYQSALCRSQADWIVGINATRLFSLLHGDTLNVGRVMTPTLALIVEREKEIKAFTKVPFYTVELDCHNFTVSSEKFKDKQAADTICAKCDGKTANITAIEKQEKSIMPPKLYDLTTLQREANRLHGFTSQQTLNYVQSLYEKKLVTYPRTDSRYLTDDMAEGLPSLVEAAANVIPFTKGLKPPIDVMSVINNGKVTDHHGIIPTHSMYKTDLSSLPSGEREILYMISVRLVCAVNDKHVYAETIVTVECENNLFTVKGKTILEEGWKSIDQAYKDTLKNKSNDDVEVDKSLPELNKGKPIENIIAKLRKGFSSPPKHFTEDTLLSAMECAGDFSDIPDAERKGLGTPATRADIIEKLVKRGFVERKEAKKIKKLIPTEKGVNLINILPEVIKSPVLTANWENMLKQVEHGKLTGAAFMTGIEELINNIIKIYPLQQSEIIGVCPRCGKNINEGKKGFFCENGKCYFALWKDNKFFSSKKKELTKPIAAALLNEGRVFISGLYSERTGKDYDATIILNDTGGKYVNFELDFGSKDKK